MAAKDWRPLGAERRDAFGKVARATRLGLQVRLEVELCIEVVHQRLVEGLLGEAETTSRLCRERGGDLQRVREESGRFGGVPDQAPIACLGGAHLAA